MAPSPSLQKTTEDSDLVFKGVALENVDVEDAELKDGGFKAQETRFRVLSILKGEAGAEVTFRSFRPAPATVFGWTPQFYDFKVGAPYVVWAKRGADGRLRQTVRSITFGIKDPGACRAGDELPAQGEVGAVMWREWNTLLASKESEDVVYALDHLAGFSSGDRFRDKADFKAEEVRPLVQPFLRSDDPQILQAAIKAAQATGVKDSLDSLLAVAASPAPAKERAQAIDTLRDQKDPRVEATMQRLLDEPGGAPEVQIAALGVLGGWNNASNRARVLRFVSSPAREVRAASARAMGQMNDESLWPTLLQLTKDPDDWVQREAFGAFAQAKSPSVRPYWEKLRLVASVQPLFTVLLAKDQPERYLLDLERIVRTDAPVAISGEIPTYTAWHLLFDYLQKQPAAAWPSSRIQSLLSAMESGPKYFWSSSAPESLYKLERQKGQEARALAFRAKQEKSVGYDMGFFFKRADDDLARENLNHN